MKSTYYDLVDRYYSGFCGNGDEVEVRDESDEIVKGTVKNCSITAVTLSVSSGPPLIVSRSSIISINHCIQHKNKIPIEANDLISIPQGEDRDVRCLAVVLRQNAPYANIRVLTGQNMSEIMNIWLKKLQFVAKGFSLELYNQLEEEDMNISYNSLAEFMDVDPAHQLAAISELFNPLRVRAKLYSNPLFRNEVMNNDALKKWSKDMLRKTKAMANMLVTPASPSDDEDSSPSVSPPVRSIMPPEYYSDDDDLVIEAPRVNSELTPSRGMIQLSRNRSQDSPLEEKSNFFSKLFKPKKKSETSSPVARNPPLSNHCSRPSLEFSSDSNDSPHNRDIRNFRDSRDSRDPRDSRESRESKDSRGFRISQSSQRLHDFHDSLDSHDSQDSQDSQDFHDSQDSRDNRSVDDSNFDHFSYDEGMTQDYKPMLQRRSSEQGTARKPPKQTRRIARPIPDDLLSSEVEHASCVWLNVNAQHPSMAPSLGSQRGRSYVSPPPAQPVSPDGSMRSDEDSPEMDVFVSIDSTEGSQAVGFDFDQYMKDAETSSRSSSGFYESKGVQVDPARVNDDLVDLSALGIPFSPSSFSSPSENVAEAEPVVKTANPFLDSDSDEEVPEGFIKPGVVRRSRQLRLERGIGLRRIPSFRKRVVLLPPLPIARQGSSVEGSGNGKQVRFFTNVLCHEYQSY